MVVRNSLYARYEQMFLERTCGKNSFSWRIMVSTEQHITSGPTGPTGSTGSTDPPPLTLPRLALNTRPSRDDMCLGSSRQNKHCQIQHRQRDVTKSGCAPVAQMDIFQFLCSKEYTRPEPGCICPASVFFSPTRGSFVLRCPGSVSARDTASNYPLRPVPATTTETA